MSFEEPKFVYKQRVMITSGFYVGQEGVVVDMFLPYGTNSRLYSVRTTDQELICKIKEYEMRSLELEGDLEVLEEPTSQEPEELTWWNQIWRYLKCIGL